VQQSSQGSAPKRPSGGGGAAGVYKVAPDGIVSRIFDGHDTMILSLAVTDGRLLVGTGKSAHVYELGCRGDDEEACIAGVDPKQVMSLLVTREGRVLAGCAGPGRIYALSKMRSDQPAGARSSGAARRPTAPRSSSPRARATSATPTRACGPSGQSLRAGRR
jgi:hypothetical protein